MDVLVRLSLMLVLLGFLYTEVKPSKDGLREEITVDKSGAKRVRIVDERAPTTKASGITRAKHKIAESAGVDDEDSDEGVSSGDGSRMENREFKVANDEPRAPRNESATTASPPQPVKPKPTTLAPHLNVSASTAPAKDITTISAVSSNTPSPLTKSLPNLTTAKPVVSTTELVRESTTGASVPSIAVSGTTVRSTGTTSSQSTTAAHDTTHSTYKTATTTPATKPATKPTTYLTEYIKTTVTLLKTSTETPATEVLQITTKGSAKTEQNITNIPPTDLVNVSNDFNTSTGEDTLVKTTTLPPITKQPAKISPTTEKTAGVVRGQENDREPEKKKRKVLFGFVTLEILIALLAGALFSVLLVAFLVYRLKKRNEGSYELSETIALRPKELDEMGKKKEVFV